MSIQHLIHFPLQETFRGHFWIDFKFIELPLGLEKTNATKNNSSSNSSSGGLFPDTLPFYVYDEDISLMGEIQ